MPKRKNKGGPEISFDPEARRNYLRGFSERKKQRRAYGLAMQKVKDRNERLIDRKDRKAALMEQIEQSEKAKQQLLEATIADYRQIGDNDEDTEDNTAAVSTSAAAAKKESAAEFQIKKYNDQETEKRWGGQVVVTTSTAIPGEDSDDDQDVHTAKKPAASSSRPRTSTSSGKPKHKDKAQEYAGSVDRFLGRTLHKLLPPGKARKAQHRGSVKGKHGASEMKGVGGSAGLKAAQSILKRSKGKLPQKDSKKKKRR